MPTRPAFSTIRRNCCRTRCRTRCRARCRTRCRAGSRAVVALGLFAAILAVAGCTTGGGPTRLVIEGGHYGPAFDAAVETLRREGYEPVLIDRRRGAIETAPRHAASVLEPWGRPSPSSSIEDTIQQQRRRVRLEFQPIEALPDPDAAPGVGPDLLGIRGPDADLPARTAAGVVELELRARVTVERRHAPGLRRGTWSRAGSSQTIVIDPVTGERLPAALWTPLGRDEAAERSLLAGIDRRLASTGTRPSESAPGPPAAAPSPAP